MHLLISSDDPNGAGQLMKALGQRYVQYMNRTYRRSGTLWEGRFRSCLTQDGRIDRPQQNPSIPTRDAMMGFAALNPSYALRTGG